MIYWIHVATNTNEDLEQSDSDNSNEGERKKKRKEKVPVLQEVRGIFGERRSKPTDEKNKTQRESTGSVRRSGNASVNDDINFSNLRTCVPRMLWRHSTGSVEGKRWRAPVTRQSGVVAQGKPARKWLKGIGGDGAAGGEGRREEEVEGEEEDTQDRQQRR